MVEIKDKISYLAETSKEAQATNKGFKEIIEFVINYLNSNWVSEKNNIIFFYGNPNLNMAENIDISWEIDDLELNEVLTNALNEFNNK